VESLQACGIASSTFYLWMRDEGFAERVREARRDGLLRVKALAEARRPWQSVALQLEADDPEGWAQP
jgi:hypothetical protein